MVCEMHSGEWCRKVTPGHIMIHASAGCGHAAFGKTEFAK